MSDIKDLQKRVAAFIDTRDWRQFHEDPKNTLLALGGELGELMELYRFTTPEEARDRAKERQTEIEDELGDILYILLMFCDQNGIDLEAAFERKEAKREAKYPVAKFKGVNAKYSEL